MLHVHVYTIYTGTTNHGPSNFTYLPNITLLPINLTCNVTGVVTWRINGTFYKPTNHTNGHHHAGTNLLIDSPVYSTEYICVSTNNYSVLISDPAWIIIAGEDLHVICYVVHITVLQINEYNIICDYMHSFKSHFSL